MMLCIMKRLALLCVLPLSACGTTYVLPDTSGSTAQASAMFAEARQDTNRGQISKRASINRFNRVAARIEPVAESFCRQETAGRQDFDCDVTILIDREMDQRNAYFTYIKDRPVVAVTLPMLRDIKNDDELAFILGHEYGHLIGRHIEKGQQQAVAGALLLGALATVAMADPYTDPNLAADVVVDSVELGYALGDRAFSQEYELESDTLGTVIARAAGYDPVVGARYFARGEGTRREDGKLSFWGTHPPDAKRVATVIATVETLEGGGALARK